MRVIHAHDHGVSHLAFTTSGDLLAAGAEDGSLALFATKGGERAGSASAHAFGLHQLAFSPDDSVLLTVGGDFRARVWELPSCELEREVELHHTAAHAWVYDGRGFPHPLPESLHENMHFMHLFGSDGSASAAFSADQEFIVTVGSDGCARLWTAMDLELAAEFEAKVEIPVGMEVEINRWHLHRVASDTIYPDLVAQALVSPDSQLLVTLSAFGPAHL
jgi:WD40 repeat protein